MKEQVFVKTANVDNATKAIMKLLARPINEMVGLGMIYGDPGLGKSRFAKQMCYRKGYLYIRLEASETAKSFSQKLWRGLKYQLNLTSEPTNEMGNAPGGSTNSLVNLCIRILMDAPHSVIMIDEFDNALPNRELRETIRDIVDQTFATVILIGMSGVRDKLERTNPHFFDRSNFFCEFNSLSVEDVTEICKKVCEFELSPKLIETAHKASAGQFRKLIKTLMLFEDKIRNKRAVTLTAKDMKEIENAGDKGSK
ncbi:MAG: ATP-binding protein [Candidatus Cloacimonetes bacterium]|nr:ATP-binding protein [Candidatus Cloacimonadota bacterium]